MAQRYVRWWFAAAVVVVAAPLSPSPAAQSAAEAERRLAMASAHPYDPPKEVRVTVAVTGAPLADVLDDIGRQSGTRMIYEEGVIDSPVRVSLSIHRVPLDEALATVLRGTGLVARPTLSGDAMLIKRAGPGGGDRAAAPGGDVPGGPAGQLRGQVITAAAPDGVITGRAVDAATNQPLAGVAITLVGVQRGATTDAEGRFTITGVPAGSYQLRAARIGFGELTRSITVTDGQSTSVDFRLQGQVLQLEGIVAVGYGTQRRQDVTGAVASLSPERLREVPVTNVAQALQGAVPGMTVTAGSAGAEQNGLGIQIRGRNSIAASNRPLVVVDGIPYDGALSEINQADVASINVLKDASSAAIYGARGANGVILITTRRGATGRPRFAYRGHVGMQEIANLPSLMTGAEFAEFKCGRLSGGTNCNAVLTATERSNLEAGRTVDWIDLATRRGREQQHSASFSGGTEETKYYISGSVLDVSGVAVNDDFERYTLRVNLDQTVTDWFRVGSMTQLSHADRSGVPANFERAFFMNPLANPFEADGRTPARDPWPEDLLQANPLENLVVIDENVTRRAIANGFAEVDLPVLKGLSYRINAGFDYANGALGRYEGRNTRSGYSNQGIAITEQSNSFDWTIENILRFQRSWGEHRLDLTGLYSAQATDYEEERVRAQGFPNDVLSYYQGEVAALVVPTYEVRESNILSQMGRLNYGYGGRYLLTLTARRDGYSGFGVDDKYGVFPSVAVAWNAVEEPFLSGLPGISDLKLRASYGKNGNQAIAPYGTLARMEEQSYLDGSTPAPGYRPVTLGNPSLRWETTTSFNLGLDYGFVDNRIRGSIDGYWSRTEDLLLRRAVSSIHGIGSVLQNIGEVKNRGVELGLSALAVDRSDFNWRLDLNLSANRNEIVDLYGDGQDDVANRWFIGRPVEVNYGYAFGGIWQTADEIAASAQPTAKPGDVRIRDVNADGKITAEDRTFIGHREPRYTAGLTSSMEYRGARLTASAYGVQGLHRLNPLLEPDVVWEGVRRNTVTLDYWSPTNPISTYPANREDVNPLGLAFYEDASFIRLRDVTLSFELPGRVRDAVRAEGLRLYVSGRNLATISDWTGLDPELSNQRAIPLERSLIIGADVSF